MTARIHDVNGWYEIAANPISKAGVFEYAGSSIAGHEGLDPNRLYNVLRPASELADPECLASFRLLPFVDDHTMLGSPEIGLTPTERKGAHGVLGEDIRFVPGPLEDDGTLYSNLKVWSDGIENLISSGKRELSCGYRCVYERAPGTWNGKPYEFIQRKIRGNHIALVAQGRMGPEVAVLDHMKFTCDAKDFKMTIKAAGDNEDPNKKTGDEGEEGSTDLNKVIETVAKMAETVAAIREAVAPAAATEVTTEAGEDDDTDPENKANQANPSGGGDSDVPKAMDAAIAAIKKSGKPGAAMDAAIAAVKSLGAVAQDSKHADAVTAAIKKVTKQVEALAADAKANASKDPVKEAITQIAARDTLAKRLVPHIGAFDASDKTLAEVQAYGAEKLGVKPEDVNGYLTAADKAAAQSARGFGFVADTAVTPGAGKNPVLDFVSTHGKTA